MHTGLPAFLALASAVLLAVGTVLRQRASHASGAIGRGWWLGAVVAFSGFALQAAALGLGSILLVQPLVVLAVLFALPMEAWADYRRPRRREWTWGGVLVVCVVVFLAIARPEPSRHRPHELTVWATVLAIIVVVAACVICAERSSPHYKALFYGLAAGTLFGASAMLVKAVIYQVVHRELAVFTFPEIYLFAVVVTGAVFAQQRGFGAGELQTSFPAMTVMEPVVAMALGVLLLGENVQVSVPTALFLGIVLAATIRAVVELAKCSAERAEHFGES